MRIFLIFVSAALLLTAGWVILSAPTDGKKEASAGTQSQLLENNQAVKKRVSVVLQEKQSLTDVLQEYFATSIHSLNTQVELYNLRARLFQDNENFTPSQFNAAVTLAFPVMAESLFQFFDKLDTYFAWLNSEQSWLNSLSSNSRIAELWQKRYTLFGTQANEIWSDERQGITAKRQEFKLVLAELDADQTITLEEKLYQLNLRTQELMADETVQFTKPESLVYQSFFTLDSVQKSLEKLTAEERQHQVNVIRRQLGFTEQQIESLASEDKIRNERWERGLAYMERRQELIESYADSDLEKVLDELRAGIFGIEAETIKREEEADFFRYNRPRVYGRNS